MLYQGGRGCREELLKCPSKTTSWMVSLVTVEVFFFFFLRRVNFEGIISFCHCGFQYFQFSNTFRVIGHKNVF